MNIRVPLLLLLSMAIITSTCQSPTMSKENEMKKKNHLANETSPYLLQHMYNPVDWHPWTKETLQKAKDENKLLLISVGYSACHWCHVMEHESFEDSTVAKIMNDFFLPIKVDREERPDVDDVYMTACQLVSQRGCGWPLNAFALPDGRPFWAGTYFPKDEWIKILKHFSSSYSEDPSAYETAAENLTKGINQSAALIDFEGSSIMDEGELFGITQKYLDLEDKKWGGRRGAPKFPMPNNYLYLMKYYRLYPNQNILDYLNNALTKMAQGGIYDQIGGGFARYSVDEKWKAPHFEKMLYDNGQLVQVYSEAYRLTSDPLYKQVVEQSLDFVKRELTDKDDVFYSALDADSEGEEGKFYVWKNEEIDHVLTDPELNKIAKTAYNITPNGNWEEGQNILFRTASFTKLAEQLNVSETELSNKLNEANTSLLTERSKRIKPGLDDKALTAWNALMIKGYLHAYYALENEEYLRAAKNSLNYIVDKQLDDQYQLYRNYKNDQTTIPGFLDDYALLADALVEMYQATFNPAWLDIASNLVEFTLVHFYDPQTGYFFFTSDLDDPLITRKKDISDNVIPSSNSIMGIVLFKLGHLIGKDNYIDISNKMASQISNSITKSGMPHFYSNWLQLILMHAQASKEIAVVGSDANSVIKKLRKYYEPNAIYVGSIESSDLPLLKDKFVEGSTYIYVCQNKVCKLPTTSSDQAIKMIKEGF